MKVRCPMLCSQATCPMLLLMCPGPHRHTTSWYALSAPQIYGQLILGQGQGKASGTEGSICVNQQQDGGAEGQRVWVGVRSTLQPRQIHTTFPGAPGIPGGPRNPMGPCRGEKTFESSHRNTHLEGGSSPASSCQPARALRCWLLRLFHLEPK